MCGTHPFASATVFRRSHTLPPSEMKSLYGSISRRAVSCLLYVTSAMGGNDTRSMASRRLDDGVARYLGMSRAISIAFDLAVSTHTMVQLIRLRASGGI